MVVVRFDFDGERQVGILLPFDFVDWTNPYYRIEGVDRSIYMVHPASVVETFFIDVETETRNALWVSHS